MLPNASLSSASASASAAACCENQTSVGTPDHINSGVVLRYPPLPSSLSMVIRVSRFPLRTLSCSTASCFSGSAA